MNKNVSHVLSIEHVSHLGHKLVLFFTATSSRSDTPCIQNIPVQGNTGYLSGHYAHDKGLGSMQCPWRIEGVPGQTVTITLIDFKPTKDTKTCNPLG